jgi:hypothetical protein
MTNKKEKKDALKKMLNDKTLLEMSGGGDLDPGTDNIPGNVTLAGKKPIDELLSNLDGIKVRMDRVENTLGGDNFVAKLNNDVKNKNDLEKFYNELGSLKETPYSVDDLVDNHIGGLPLYLADQIKKATGNDNINLPTGDTIDDLTDKNTNLDLITNTDKNEFNDLNGDPTNKKPVNRYLTLFDLITDDDGKFLSKDLDFILNRFSSLAQFKHLPKMEYLLQSGGSSKKNRSRKIRK